MKVQYGFDAWVSIFLYGSEHDLCALEMYDFLRDAVPVLYISKTW